MQGSENEDSYDEYHQLFNKSYKMTSEWVKSISPKKDNGFGSSFRLEFTDLPTKTLSDFEINPKKNESSLSVLEIKPFDRKNEKILKKRPRGMSMDFPKI